MTEGTRNTPPLSSFSPRTDLADECLEITFRGKKPDLDGIISEDGKIDDIGFHILEITSDDVVLDVIEESKAGDEVTLKVIPFKGSSKEIKVKLGANTNESSYVEKEEAEDKKEENDGTFDFPQGE